MNEYTHPDPDALPPDAKPGSAPARPESAEERRYREAREKCVTARGAACTLGALGVGVFFCDSILLSAPGLSVAAVFGGYQALLWALWRGREGGMPREARRLTAPIGILALGPLLHYNPSTRFVCMLTLLALCALQLVVLGGEKSAFSVPALLALPDRMLLKPLESLGLPFAALGALRRSRSPAVRTALAAALGILLALPVGGVLLALFMQADALFSASMGSFLTALSWDPFTAFCDLIIGGGLGLLLAACLLRTRYEGPSAPAPAREPAIPAAVTGAFLAVIDGVTALFVGFQFVYLFGGESTRALYSLTYSEYARRGFFELCAASAIVFAVSLLALLLTRRSGSDAPRPVRALCAMLCVCDCVVLASAFKRMALYVGTYGMSIRRLLTLWGMAVVAVCLILLLLRCLWQKLDVVRAIGLAATVGVCCLGLLNTERLVASWNADAMRAGRIPCDAASFGELSYTAAPQVEALRAALPENRDELDYVLVSMRRQLELHPRVYGFSFDNLAAHAVFERLAPELPPSGAGDAP